MITFSNKTYDQLKFIFLILLPALATLYATVGAVWGAPKVEEISGTIMALDTFGGALVLRSSKNYSKDESNHDGTIAITGRDPDTGVPDLQMMVTTHPDDFPKDGTLRLKVKTGVDTQNSQNGSSS